VAHFLADPSVWHKIDRVRVRDRKAPGGWRYYAHLLTHQAGYQSGATPARRAEIPTHRRAGFAANVSNLSVASFPDGHPEQLVVGVIACTDEQQQAAARAAKRARMRQKALDRSRRVSNPNQYGPSVRQQARAARRADCGLADKQVTNPGGPRHSRADGVPLRAYRRDTLSVGYHRTRAVMFPRCGGPVRPHTPAPVRSPRGSWQPTATPSPWRTVRSPPGRACGANGPRCSAPACWWPPLKRECEATGGMLSRAGTRSTALSQHCLCGARVTKTLAQRTHDCPHCGLQADRDAISAMLAACVKLDDPDDPGTARVDYQLARAIRAGLASQQEWEGSVNRHQPLSSSDAGSARTGSHHPVTAAEQAEIGLPPNRPGTPGRRGPSRKQPAPKLIGAAGPGVGQHSWDSNLGPLFPRGSTSTNIRSRHTGSVSEVAGWRVTRFKSG
jgi:hypothetical protein